MSSDEAGQMSAVETGQMSAAETGQMSAVEARQMSTIETGLLPRPILQATVGGNFAKRLQEPSSTRTRPYGEVWFGTSPGRNRPRWIRLVANFYPKSASDGSGPALRFIWTNSRGTPVDSGPKSDQI